MHVPTLKFLDRINEKQSNNDILREANIRLCRLRTWSNYNGLGFQITKSSQPPHLISLVESNSPASAGGLKISDVLLAINDENVSNTDYGQVIAILNSIQEDIHRPIELLVVELHFYQILKKRNIIIDSSLATVINTPISMTENCIEILKHRPRICQIQLQSKDIHFGFDVVNRKDGIGMYVQEVVPNSPAYQAGLRKSDRIIEIDGKYVEKNASKLILEKLNKAVIKRAVTLLVQYTDTYVSHSRNNQSNNNHSLPINESNLVESLPPTHEYIPLHNNKQTKITMTSLVENKSHYEELHPLNGASSQNENPIFVRKQPVKLDRTNPNFQISDHELHAANDEYENPDDDNSSTTDSYEIPLSNSRHQTNTTTTISVKENDVSNYIEPSHTRLGFNYKELKNDHNIQQNLIKDSEHYKVDQRFFDVQNEPLSSFLPIEGYEGMSLLPLNIAIENLEVIIPELKRKASLALDRSSNPTDGLTSDESASIQLYTMRYRSDQKSLSMNLNDALRATDRARLIPYFPYLKLILTALEKLQNVNTIVWRGVKADLRNQYPIDKIFVWWGFSSCVESRNLLESDKYLGKQGIRTIFNIECKTGKSIRSHSYYKHNNEILLLPATQLQVIKQDKVTDDFYIIYLKEIQSIYHLFQSSSDTNYSLVSLVVDKNTIQNEKNLFQNEHLKKFINNHKMENSICFSEQSLTINDMYLIMDELHTNKYWYEISFYGMHFTEECIKILMHGLQSKQIINSLVLKSNQLDDNISSIIARALTINKSLKNVDLTNNQITEIGAQAFANMLSINTSLLNLNLSFNPIGNNGIDFICHALQNNDTLESLYLNRINLTSKSAQMLAFSLKLNTNLKILHLNENHFDDKGISIISRSLIQNKQLNILHLAMNNITSEGAVKIAMLLQQPHSSLVTLNISDNPLGDAGVISIAQALIKNTTLIELHLDSVKMTIDGLQELIKMIPTNDTLKYLSLKKNEINDHGMALLLDGLQFNNVLTHLYLNNNKLTDEYISSIATVLNSNPKFQCLHLSDNQETDKKELPCDNETMKINIPENIYY